MAKWCTLLLSIPSLAPWKLDDCRLCAASVVVFAFFGEALYLCVERNARIHSDLHESTFFYGVQKRHAGVEKAIRIGLTEQRGSTEVTKG